jgi:carboxymethylenebutenolidase
MQAYLARPGGAQPSPSVVVCHELFGVTPDIESVADRLAAQGFTALAPELYHRDAPPRTALPRDDEGRATGFGYLNGLTRDGVIADLGAAWNWLREDDATTAAVGALGLSMGGHLAYLAATQVPFLATAVLYGGWLTGTDIPPSTPQPTILLTPGIEGAVLYVVGSEDSLVSGADRDEIERALVAAGVVHELVVQPGAGHAFLWPGTPAYDEAATADTWSRVDRFFASELGR